MNQRPSQFALEVSSRKKTLVHDLKALNILNESSKSFEISKQNPILPGILCAQTTSSDDFSKLENIELFFRHKPDIESFISIWNGKGKKYSIPSLIAFQSQTIRHIWRGFSGSTHPSDIICFASLSDPVLLDVIWYLYYKWIKTQESFCVSFYPQMESILSLMMASLYLNLPDLSDICATLAANNIHCIDSFGDLPLVAIKSILTKLNVLQLVFWEQNNRSISTQSIWTLNLQKLVKSNRLSFPVSTSSARTNCITFYIQEIFSNPHYCNSEFIHLVTVESKTIEEISLHLKKDHANVLQWNDWYRAIQHLAHITHVKLNLRFCNTYILAAIRHFASTRTILQISLHCEEDVYLLHSLSITESLKKITNLLIEKRQSYLKHTEKKGSTIESLNYSLSKSKTKLDISGINHFIADSQDTIQELLSEDMVFYSNLCLQLQGSLGKNSFELLSSISPVLDFKSLTDLNFSHCLLSYHSVPIIIQTLPLLYGLEKLSLADTGISAKGLIMLIPCISQLKLRSIDLSGILIETSNEETLNSAKAIAKYISQSTHLQELHMDRNDFSISGGLMIANGVQSNPSIHTLSLSKTGIKTNFSFLMKALKQRKLKMLDVSFNSISSRSLTEIKNNLANIQKLYLNGNALDSLTLELIANVLETQDHYLCGLHISHTLQPSNNTFQLHHFVKYCSQLEELDLSGNGLNNKICKELARILPNSTLRYINLSNNIISIQGVEYFCRVPMTNCVQINLKHNNISLEQVKKKSFWPLVFLF